MSSMSSIDHESGLRLTGEVDKKPNATRVKIDR